MKDEKIKLKFRHAYRKCEEDYNYVCDKNIKECFHQRMDEILLIYSNMFDISVNESKKLKQINDDLEVEN